MVEWSKAFVLGNSIFGGNGSNLIAANIVVCVMLIYKEYEYENSIRI